MASLGNMVNGVLRKDPSTKKADTAVSSPLTGKVPLEQVVRRALTDEVLTTLRMAEQLGSAAFPCARRVMTLERTISSLA